VTTALIALNLVLGLVYTAYGIITVFELSSQRHARGLNHFGLAWVAMAFTCGPHHLDHGLHLALGRPGTGMELLPVAIGLGPGLAWFLLRMEALRGGLGDREVRVGTPALRVFAVVVGAALATSAVWIVLRGAPVIGQEVLTVPNVLLVGLYAAISALVLSGQLANRRERGAWSVAGIGLTLVFATCALMHAAYVVDAAAGGFPIDVHGLVVGWVGVPAAVYFLWVVWRMRTGTLEPLVLPPVDEAMSARRAALTGR
jgi:hypothetical protein